jgi:hypothetical protein
LNIERTLIGCYELSRSEYHDQKVRPKLKHRPWLDILHEFLDPNNKNFSVETQHRLSFFDIGVIHISASGNVDPPIKCKDTTAFKQAVSTVGNS